MTKNTKSAIVAIMATDPSISAEQRDAALAALEGGAKPLAPLLPMVKASEVQRLLGASRTTIWHLRKAGALVPVLAPGSKRVRGFTRQSVEAYLRGNAAAPAEVAS